MEGMTTREYFFYEWLILEKRITSDKLQLLTQQEMDALACEYTEFERGIK